MSSEPLSQEIDKVNALKMELQQYLEKLSELELEKEEYQVVLSAMKEMTSERKCFRQVSGVLIEQTVAEALPFLENQLNGLTSSLKQIMQQKENKQKELLLLQQKITSN